MGYHRDIISTSRAPEAIGPYSQAVRAGNTVYLSGQIPLDPTTMTLVSGGIEIQIKQVLDNLQAVADAAGGDLDALARITIYLTDLNDFATVNDIMAQRFNPPYPARATVQVAALPKGAAVEIDAIMVL
ncbi:MAG: RidA family protein [Pseudohongiellaceae bacterium]